MVWFKVDDDLAFHAKTMQAGNAAMGVWVRAGSYCGQHLTDGFVSREVALTIGKRSEINRLVDVGLWEPAEIEGKGGWRFHEWVDRQPSREEVEKKREEEAQRKAAWRAKRAAQRAAGQDPDDTVPDANVPPGQPPDTTWDTYVSPTGVPDLSRSSRPDPTRPDPVSPNGDTPSLRSGSEADASAPNAGKIVKTWIDRQRRRPAERVIGPVAKQVRELLDQNFTAAEIDAGLVAMDTKALHPSTLSSLVSAAANANARSADIPNIRRDIPPWEDFG